MERGIKRENTKGKIVFEIFSKNKKQIQIDFFDERKFEY